MENNFPIFISTGDPLGIGPEVSVKSLKFFKSKSIYLIGSYNQLENLIEKYSHENKDNEEEILTNREIIAFLKCFST